MVDTPSASGTGQRFARCPRCKICIWSNYDGIMDRRYVRVGTLDEPQVLPPDVHIFTASKLPWVTLSKDKPIVEEYYDKKDIWSIESLERLKVLKDRNTELKESKS